MSLLLHCESNAFPNVQSKRKTIINVSSVRSIFIKYNHIERSFEFGSHQMVSSKLLGLINCENPWLIFIDDHRNRDQMMLVTDS